MNPHPRRSRLLLSLVLLGATPLLARPVAAATFTVNDLGDVADAAIDGTCATAGGACTLRAAIQEANATAGLPADTINVPAGTITLGIAGANEDNAATGDLDITAPVTIVGAPLVTGLPVTIADGGGIDRILDIFPEADPVSISGVTVQNGNLVNSALKFGGAIWNGVTLTLTDVRVLGSTGAGSGGGIHNDNVVILTNVTIAGNSTTVAPNLGGGLFNSFEEVSSQLTNVTVSGNTASSGGGILNNGIATLTNVTLSGNTATGTSGGGFRNNFQATLRNVTIVGNGAVGGGGGINHPGDTSSVTNTIIASNTPTNCTGLGAFESQGSNLVSDDSCPLGAPGDMGSVDPVLGALADNGGPTQTHLILAGSPTIDTGANCTPPDTDQRGTARPLDGDNDGTFVCDIGAVETTFPPTPNTTTTPTSSTTSTTAPRPRGQGLSGKVLSLKDDPARPARRRLLVLSRDRQLNLGAGNGSAHDPVIAGAMLRVSTAAGDGFDATYPLPATGWAYIGAAGRGKGYRYRDAGQALGPIGLVVVRNGRLLKVVGRGARLEQSLAADPDPVTIVLTLGARDYCLGFGGQPTFRPGSLFKAKGASAPGSCPP